MHAQDNNDPFEHNTSTGSACTTAISVQNHIRIVGNVMPRACTIKKWTGWSTGSGSDDITIGLFKLTPINDSNSTRSPVLLDSFTYEAGGNAYSYSFAETPDTTAAAGDILFTGVKTETAGQTVYFTCTAEVEF